MAMLCGRGHPLRIFYHESRKMSIGKKPTPPAGRGWRGTNGAGTPFCRWVKQALDGLSISRAAQNVKHLTGRATLWYNSTAKNLLYHYANLKLEATMGSKPMKPLIGPLGSLLYSRKFLVLMLDTVVSMVLYYYGGPNVEFLIAALQPVVLMLIYAIAKEDAAKFAGG